MDDFWTRCSIWLALLAYAGWQWWLPYHGDPAENDRAHRSRQFATLGLFAYLVHVGLAFDQHHDWSHLQALLHTAQRTEEVTGLSSGVGIYVNYAFSLLWLIEVTFWWAVGHQRYLGRHSWWLHSVMLIFLFMIVNGAIVFAAGPARWIGCAVVLVTLRRAWARAKRRGDAGAG